MKSGFAIREPSLGDHIATHASVEDRTGGVERRVDFDHSREMAILDDDGLERILGEVTRLGNHDRNRFASVAHPIDCEWPMLHRLLDPHHKGLRPALNIIASQYRSNPRQSHCPSGIDREEFGVRTGRSQNSCVQHAGLAAQIVSKLATPRQERDVLDAFHGTTKMRHALGQHSCTAICGPGANLNQFARPQWVSWVYVVMGRPPEDTRDLLWAQ